MVPSLFWQSIILRKLSAGKQVKVVQKGKEAADI